MSPVTRVLSLSAALFLAVPLAAPTGVEFGVAQAADFGGKIKRIRIRPTSKPGDYKVIVVVKDDTSQPIKELDTTVVLTAEGDAPEAKTTGDADWRRHVLLSEQTMDEDGDDASLDVQIDDEVVTVELGDDVGSWSLEDDWRVVTTETYSVGVRWTGTGPYVMSVRLAYLDADRVFEEAPTLSVSGETLGTVEMDWTESKIRSVQSFTVDADTADGYTYSYEAQLTDAQGNVLDTMSGRTELDTETGASLYSSKVKQKRNGDLKHVLMVYNDTAELEHSMDLLLSDADSGEVLLDVTGETAASRVRNFFADGAFFESDPDGYVYNATVSLYDAEGTWLDAADVDLYPSDGTWGTTDFVLDDALQINGEGEQMYITVGDRLSNVGSIEVQVNEPWDGPDVGWSPLRLEYGETWTRYVHTADVGGLEPTEVQVDVALYDDEDGLEDSATHTVTVGGAVAKSRCCYTVIFKPTLIGLEDD